jgi:hypothetical protein
MSEGPKPLKPGKMTESNISGYISLDGPGKDVLFFLDCPELDLAFMGHASGDIPGGFKDSRSKNIISAVKGC